jgi:hypothetical protein
MAISRRKYHEVIKFLKETIGNQKAPLRLRYACASRLDDIYKRSEIIEARVARKKAGQQEISTEETTLEAEELDADLSAEELEEERVQKIFADILAPIPVATATSD